jgi:hypothetical protein
LIRVLELLLQVIQLQNLRKKQKYILSRKTHRGRRQKKKERGDGTKRTGLTERESNRRESDRREKARRRRRDEREKEEKYQEKQAQVSINTFPNDPFLNERKTKSGI